MIAPIRASIAVDAARDLAFERFVHRFGDWWPPEYSWSGSALVAIGLDPFSGGACYEIGPHGFRCDWGRVLAHEPPGRVSFTWQIGPTRTPEPDPARGSTVTVTFAAAGPAVTSVALEHGEFERHGEGGAGYRDALGSAAGWPLILQRFAAYASSASRSAEHALRPAPGRYRVVPLEAGDQAMTRAAAELLVNEFRDYWPLAWPTLGAAEREVAEALAPGKIALAATGAPDGALLGWIGGQPHYGGRVWELHPLVVRREQQGRGMGRTLVAALEAEVAGRGALTLWVGTDDEAGLTSVAGLDLYPDLLGRLAEIRNLRRHPFEFYRKLGFVLAGAVPDANGFGKPDLLLAKRVRSGTGGAPAAEER